MVNRFVVLYVAFMVGVCFSFAQERKKIDRTTPKTEQKRTTVSTSRSSSSSSATKPSVKTAPKKKPIQQSFFNISSRSADFGSEGGTKTFTVSSSGTWNVSVNTANWGHLTRSGNTLTLRIDANTSSSSRSDYFIIASGSKTLRVDISQAEGRMFSVSSQQLSFPASGGSQIITVRTSSSWRIGTNTCGWGHLSIYGDQLTVRLDANTGTSSRTDYFTIKSGDQEIRVNISQNGSSTNSTISKKATIKAVTVSNNSDVDGKKGLSVFVSFDISGMKDKDAKISCYFYDNNGNALLDTNNKYGTTGTQSHVASSKDVRPSYESSTFTDVEIKIPYDELHLSGMYSRTLRVDVLIWDYSTSNHTVLTRKENTSFICVSNTSYLKVDGSTSNKTKYFGENGGSEYYSVSTSASSYETWGVPSWCSIENKTSSGFTLVCNRNTNRTSRSDYMKIVAAGQEIRIDIKQEASSGPTATITSIEQEHNAFNGNVKGMRIKLKFDVIGMLNRSVKATAWFYYGDNTTKLNNGYGGQVNVSNSDTAPYENTTFTMTLFMPYNSLNMAHGFNGDLSFDIVITDSYGNQLARQDNKRFNFSQP